MEKNMINTPEGMEILDTSVPGIEKVLTEAVSYTHLRAHET